jgi:hypothetical protein
MLIEKPKPLLPPKPDWMGSFFQHHETRFLRNHRFWVEQAKPPEDYIYENLSFDRFNRYCRIAASRLAVVAVLLLCAVGVTKLMKMSRDLSSKIIWEHGTLNRQVGRMAQVGPEGGCVQDLPICLLQAV